MCMLLPNPVLESPENELKYADEPIVCYKVLREDPETTTTFKSPFQMFTYGIGAEYTAHITYDNAYVYVSDTTHASVERGFHSFVKLDDALELCQYANRCFQGHTDFDANGNYIPNKFTVVECVIPKGTAYHVGKWDDDTSNFPDNYASAKIRLISVVKKAP